MKIAIDISPLNTAHAGRGIGFYTKNLVEALKKEVNNGNVNIEFDFHTHILPHTLTYDLIHYPYFDLFFKTLPLKKPMATVVTVHDVTPLVFPEHYPPGIKGRINFLIQKFSLGKVDGIITDSKNSQDDIAKYLGYPKEKIHVVFLAPREIFKKLETDRASPKAMPAARNWKLETRKKYSLPEEFVLYVGDVNWNKNILGLVEACKKIGKPLVIVGKQAKGENFDRGHIENRPLVQLIEQYGQDPDIKRLGFVEEHDLVKIYNLATVYCQPSYYEGFGLPVLEAMACGCPVISSNTSSLPEICGEAALMFDPYNIDNLSAALEKIFQDKDLRVNLSKKGLIQAKKFSWERTARETLDVYKKILVKI